MLATCHLGRPLGFSRTCQEHRYVGLLDFTHRSSGDLTHVLRQVLRLKGLTGRPRPVQMIESEDQGSIGITAAV